MLKPIKISHHISNYNAQIERQNIMLNIYNVASYIDS